MDETVPDAPERAAIQVPNAPTLGFEGPLTWMLAAGVVLVILTGLFQTIILTSDDPGRGLIEATIWFGWIASTLVSSSMMGAGFLGKHAAPGIRVAMFVVGAFLFVQGTSGVATLLNSMARAFSMF